MKIVSSDIGEYEYDDFKYWTCLGKGDSNRNNWHFYKWHRNPVIHVKENQHGSKSNDQVKVVKEGTRIPGRPLRFVSVLTIISRSYVYLFNIRKESFGCPVKVTSSCWHGFTYPVNGFK